MRYTIDNEEEIKNIMFQAVSSKNSSTMTRSPTTRDKRPPGTPLQSPLFPEPGVSSETFGQVLVIIMNIHKQVLDMHKKIDILDRKISQIEYQVVVNRSL